MKKFVLMLVVILLVLTGCSKGEEKNNLDLKGAASAVDKKFSNMNEMDADEISAIYGVDVENFGEYVIKSSSLNNGDLYAIIKVKDGKRNDVKNDMSKMFDTLVSQSNLYSPEAVEKLNNRLETSVGDYLIYLVSEDNNALYDIIKGYIS